MPDKSQPSPSLFSIEFLSLNFTVFFGFCNLAMFYGFYGYLEKIGIPVEWRGFLVGLEPMAAFAVRLLVIPFLHIGNSFRAMFLSLLLIMLALSGYRFAVTVPSLMALRVLHGGGFVLLVSSATVLLVACIPKHRSAQGFAIMSVCWLVPYAVMPAVFGFLARVFSNESDIYAVSAVMAIPGLFLLLATRKRIRNGLASFGASAKPPRADMFMGLRQPGICVLLVVCFALYFCNNSVFFFIQTLLSRSGFGDAGTFLTVSTLTVIATRVFVGKALDRANKWRITLFFLPMLIVCLLGFGRAHSFGPVLLLAAVFGLCLGVLFPIMNAAVFLSSPPHLRGSSINVAQLVMDLAYLSSPPLAGALLTRGFRPATIFDLCAVVAAAGFVLLVAFRSRGPEKSGSLVFDLAESEA